MLAILETLVQKKRGSYLLTDTDSMLFCASEHGGLYPSPGGKHKMRDGAAFGESFSKPRKSAKCVRLGVFPIRQFPRNDARACYDAKCIRSIAKTRFWNCETLQFRARSNPQALEEAG